jgi:hypothetical protein
MGSDRRQQTVAEHHMGLEVVVEVAVVVGWQEDSSQHVPYVE